MIDYRFHIECQYERAQTLKTIFLECEKSVRMIIELVLTLESLSIQSFLIRLA
jgi:hypothetical protein